MSLKRKNQNSTFQLVQNRGIGHLQAAENNPKKDQNQPDESQMRLFLHMVIHRAAHAIRSLCRHRPSIHQQASGIINAPTGC